MFIVVDASVWAARLVSKDVFHEPVKAWMFARLKSGDRFLAPSLLLAEIGSAIRRRTTVTLGLDATERLQSLAGLKLVEMERPLLLEAAYLAAKLGLRGADSTYVALAMRLDLPLVTLDSDQRKRAAKHINVLEISS